MENVIASSNTLGSDTLTSTNVKYPTAMTDISATTQARQLVRFGIWVKNPTGTTTLQCVRLSGWLEIEMDD